MLKKKSFWYVRQIFLWKEIQKFSGWVKNTNFFTYIVIIYSLFCGMPIIFSVIFRIHSVMLSICCVTGIICSVIVIIHLVIFTISSAVLWISCLWFIIQPIPTVILELLFHPLDSLRHSCNSACDVHNCFCDPNKIFRHPYLLCEWASYFSYDVISICCWVSEQW